MRFLNVFTVIVVFGALTASAQNNRSFVSSTGDDVRTCAVNQECRTFARAMAVTNGGGEIIALDAAGYGPLSIDRSVTITVAGGGASITASSVDGVMVAAGPSDRVVIKGLNIFVTDTFSRGIYATSFGTLSIENCSVSGGGVGIFIAGDVNSRATIANTVARNASADGFIVQSRVVMASCRAERNGASGLNVGFSASADGAVTATDFVSTGNITQGVNVLALTSGHDVFAALDHAMLANNTFDGVFCNAIAGATAQVAITNSTVTKNLRYGLNRSTLGTIVSMRNNMVYANVSGDTNPGDTTPLAVH